uniref:Long wavelength sensitive opsin n=1 Tax=Paussus spinicoxis TaxID=1561892 RepID=A0A1P8SFH7_9CARA|nr:long wavelength sensitive opsin [Paussus spinicoxis]
MVAIVEGPRPLPMSAAHPGAIIGGNLTVMDKALPDMLHLVDAYWNQFPPMNPLWHGLLGFTIGVLGFVSITGNGMVINIFSTTKSLKTPGNMLIVNLALSDFLMMLMVSPTMAISCYYETWVFGPLMCELHAFIASLFGSISIWTMTLIAMDRYNVIVKGLAAKPMTKKTAFLKLSAVWISSIVWAAFPFFGWNRYVPEGNMTACGTDYINKDWFSRSYILVYSIFCYFLPLLLIIFSYVFIVKAVAAHEKEMKEQAKKMNVASLRSSEAAQTSAEIKLAKIAMMTISLWFMAWTPYLVINYAGIFEGRKITPLFSIWGSVFAKANAVYNPIVYGISHPKYRLALMQKYPTLACAPPAADDSASTASAVTNVANEEKPAV